MASYNAVKPEQAGYNIFSPTYAASLGAKTGDPVLDNLNQLALMLRSNQEGGQYADAIKSAEASQRAGQAATDQSELVKAYLQQIAPMAKEGVAAAVGVNPDGTMSIDPTRLDQSDVIHQDNMASESYLRNTQGVKALADAGYTQSIPAVGAQITGPLETTPQTVAPYVNPGDAAAQASAAASSKSADASMIRAKREPTSSQLAKMSFIPSAYGGPGQATFRGTPEQIAAAQAAWAAQNGQSPPPLTAAKSKYVMGADGKYHRRDGTK